jgi:hypothetical protein
VFLARLIDQAAILPACQINDYIAGKEVEPLNNGTLDEIVTSITFSSNLPDAALSK